MTQSSFILRFQENCEEATLVSAASGTETLTKMMREQKDSDPTSPSFQSLPSIDISAGTATLTRIQREQNDSDFSETTRFIPKQIAIENGTSTAIKTESGDQDKDLFQRRISVLP